MANKLMYILNDNTQNYLFCSLKLVAETFELNTQLNESTNQNSRLLSQLIRKHYHENLETSVRNSYCSLSL